MPEFSKKQIDAFAFGLLEDDELEAAMLQGLADSQDSEVAARLRRTEDLARRILDPTDSLYLNLMVGVPPPAFRTMEQRTNAR